MNGWDEDLGGQPSLRWRTKPPRPWEADRQHVTEIEAVPTTYHGTTFRSGLEANWAATLDYYGIDWRYEPQMFRLPSGTLYLPDFWLPALRTFIEVKGPRMERIHKTNELAKEVSANDVITLIGFSPMMRRTTEFLLDPYLQWQDPVGYDTRFAQCPDCSARQWLRFQISRRCRRCRAGHIGLLAKAGEIPFFIARSDPYRPPSFGR